MKDVLFRVFVTRKSEGSLIEILIGDENNLCSVQIGQILVNPSKRLNLLQVSTANDRQSLRKIKDFENLGVFMFKYIPSKICVTTFLKGFYVGFQVTL